MTVISLVVAFLGLLVAFLGLLWQVLAPDLQAWEPKITAGLVERAVARLPPAERQERLEEWMRELEHLPRNAIWTRLKWAWGYGRAARDPKVEEAELQQPTALTPRQAIRQVKALRADAQLQEWLGAGPNRANNLIACLACLVGYEEAGCSFSRAANSMRCTANVVHAAIERLEAVLDERLIRAEDPTRMTPLGEDVVVAARPLVRRASTDRHATQADPGRQVITCVVSAYRGAGAPGSTAPVFGDHPATVVTMTGQLRLF